MELILILLAVAGIAALLGFGRVSGIALSAAKILIFLGLFALLLLALGIIAIV